LMAAKTSFAVYLQVLLPDNFNRLLMQLKLWTAYTAYT